VTQLIAAISTPLANATATICATTSRIVAKGLTLLVHVQLPVDLAQVCAVVSLEPIAGVTAIAPCMAIVVKITLLNALDSEWL